MTTTAANSSAWPLPPMSYDPRPAAPVRSLLPKKIDVAQLTPNNLGQLRKLNSVLFPVQYSERFYKDVLDPDSAEICKLGLFNDVAVGTICCRLEPISKDSARIYIMTLGVLAPYRRLGIASALLQHVLDHVAPGKHIQIVDKDAPIPKPKKDKNGKDTKSEPLQKTVKVQNLYLHVQTSNDEARTFYEKFGFKVQDTIDNYYRRIQPASAWVLQLQ
ncbi:related to N-alpha-acetyltransferase 50 [Melanopsichium pennsylvanicum]|uniref:Related to N-alpha-acetyltransferase 50 n=2 Tax=Melanopsichium pennsylvanicum TaxID=63383 RepID=A0AAJ4XJV9_9BASI|nr:acyl-n-acyltransferase [Melanopsichium pennsylvanicum 4]SNX82433.1 related to N-alpha-acetyltransferase 50 [Melanopsichium pennsylvanicum]